MTACAQCGARHWVLPERGQRRGDGALVYEQHCKQCGAAGPPLVRVADGDVTWRNKPAATGALRPSRAPRRPRRPAPPPAIEEPPALPDAVRAAYDQALAARSPSGRQPTPARDLLILQAYVAGWAHARAASWIQRRLGEVLSEQYVGTRVAQLLRYAPVGDAVREARKARGLPAFNYGA